VIERESRRERYTSISNRSLEDASLSFKARGLLAYILSKPDHWKTNRDQLAAASTDGVAAVRTGLQELECAGYLTRHRHKDPETGTWTWKSVVHEVPVPEERRTEGGRIRAAQPIGRFSANGQPGDVPPAQPIGRFSTGGKPADLVTTEVAKTEEERLSVTHRKGRATDDGPTPSKASHEEEQEIPWDAPAMLQETLDVLWSIPGWKPDLQADTEQYQGLIEGPCLGNDMTAHAWRFKEFVRRNPRYGEPGRVKVSWWRHCVDAPAHVRRAWVDRPEVAARLEGGASPERERAYAAGGCTWEADCAHCAALDAGTAAEPVDEPVDSGASDVLVIAWDGDVALDVTNTGYALDAEHAAMAVKLRDEGLLEGAAVVWLLPAWERMARRPAWAT